MLSIVLISYVGLLFFVAFWADRRRQVGRSVTNNSLVYFLSFGVWHTSWTFYGNVGRVATVGIDFLAIYLGASLVMFSGWFLLRRMIRISKEQNLVSIADFLSSRFGNFQPLGTVVTILAIVGTIPYIALQLKGISQTFELFFSAGSTPGEALQRPDTALVTALLLGLFGVRFGARHLDPSARHEGLVAAIAVESVFKLVAMLAVGVFITYGLFDGFGDVCQRFLLDFPERAELLALGTAQIPYSQWLALGSVCAFAFLCLPHMFHLVVVENADERHLLGAMWRFPLYMFLIDLFIIPIALGGLLLAGGETAAAEYFSIHIPLQQGQEWLAMLVFIGGFSGSAGMVMVASVALSILILNHLVVPLLLRLRREPEDVPKTLLALKRLGVMSVVLGSYLFYRIIGATPLVNIGLISFVAAAQLAPALLGGLFWRRANLKGAITGILLGAIVWAYTLVLPSLARAGWLAVDLLQAGPFGWGWLRPEALFGLEDLLPLPHALFWSLLINVGAFVSLSLLGRQSDAELEQVEKFVGGVVKESGTLPAKRLSGAPTVMEFVDLMSKFIGESKAHAAIGDYLGEQEIDSRGSLSEEDLAGMRQFTEWTLAGSVGSAPARIIVDNYLEARGSAIEDVFDIFGSVTISHKAGREQLGVLHEATRTVASGAELHSILDSVLELLHEQFPLDISVIRLLHPQKGSLTVRSQTGMTSEHFWESEREVSMDTYVGSTFLTNSVTVVNDTDFLDHPQLAQLIHREAIKSFVHAPITVEGEPLGVLSSFSRSAKGIFTEEFTDFFRNLAGQIGVACRNAEQAGQLLEARERERDMEIARNIQSGLLPAGAPQLKGVTVAGKCVQARQIGGDYYDFLLHDDETFDMLIADVSGHDVGSALLMAAARTFIHARVTEFESPGQALAALNEFLYEDLSRAELFITIFYLRYHCPSRRISYASAGHNPPLLFRRQSGLCQSLDADGLILGVKRGVTYAEETVHLGDGDLLLLYTDGITEAERSDGEFFGEERLESVLMEQSDLGAQECIDRLLDQTRLFVGSGTFNDDVTLVAVKVGE